MIWAAGLPRVRSPSGCPRHPYAAGGSPNRAAQRGGSPCVDLESLHRTEDVKKSKAKPFVQGVMSRYASKHMFLLVRLLANRKAPCLLKHQDFMQSRIGQYPFTLNCFDANFNQGACKQVSVVQAMAMKKNSVFLWPRNSSPSTETALPLMPKMVGECSAASVLLPAAGGPNSQSTWKLRRYFIRLT